MNKRTSWIAWATLAVALLLLSVAGYHGWRWYVDARRNVDTVHLLGCAYNGDDAAVRQLLARGVDPNAVLLDDESPTSLSAAVSGRHLSTVNLLLQAGADPNRSGHAISPLFTAVRNNDADIVKALLDHGATPDSSSLMNAGRTPDAKIPAMLLAAGGDPKALLHSAAFFGSTAVAQLALDALPKDAAGRRAVDASLEEAKRKGRTEVVKLLEEYRARTTADTP